MGCVFGAKVDFRAESEYIPFDPTQKCKISLKSQHGSYLYVLESGTSLWIPEQEGKGGKGNDHLICYPKGDGDGHKRVSLQSNCGFLNVDDEGNIEWIDSENVENTQIVTVCVETDRPDRFRFKCSGDRYLSFLKPNLLWTNDECSDNELFQVIVHEVYPKVEMIAVYDDAENAQSVNVQNEQ